MSAFNIWHTHKYRNFSNSFTFELEDAWNAAIDEAVKAVDTRENSDFPDSLIEQVIIRIKALKQT